jgi:hypothetical protein
MTNFRWKGFVPEDDIKVRPTSLVNEIYEIIKNHIDNEIKEERIKCLQYLYKELQNKLKNYNFWYKISSYNFCCYQYTDLNEKNTGRICGRRIDKKSSYGNGSDKYLCSEHDRKHRKYHSKPIKKKENETYCNHINKDGTNCKYSSKINGLCVKHYKYIYKVDIKEIYNKIDNIKYNIKKINIIDKYNNNGYKNLKLITYNIKSDPIWLNNEKFKIAEKCNLLDFQNVNDVYKLHLEDNNNRNIKSRSKTPLFNISNNISNIYNRTIILNEKIEKTSKLLEGIKDIYNNYIKIESKKCEANNCSNCKDYNIIYNKYCLDHMHNKHNTQLPNFFKINKNK